MKFAKQKWVRVTEARIIEIINESTIHPTYLKGYCAGCHSALAGQLWSGVWVEIGGKAGAYKLCQECTEEAKAEMSKTVEPTHNIESLTAAYADLRRRYAAAEEAGEPVLELWNQMQAALTALQEAKKNAPICG